MYGARWRDVAWSGETLEVAMETNEVSLHRLKVYLFVKQAREWLTNEDIAKGAGVAPRTARQHTRGLVGLGILDQAEVFPAHRFKISAKADTRNKAYMLRLERASEVFNLAA
jgi:hypothetical protein